MVCSRSIRAAWLPAAVVFMLASSSASGQGASFNSLQIDPPGPSISETVTATLSVDLWSSCVELCWIGQNGWVAEGHYHIDIFILDYTEEWTQQGIGCTQVVYTETQEIPFGYLAAGEYQLTADLYSGPSNIACADGDLVEQTSMTFAVTGPPIPAASGWALAACVLLLLLAGTIRIRQCSVI